MRTRRFDDNHAMAAKLAALAGCSRKELVITKYNGIAGPCRWRHQMAEQAMRL